jgi:hypothetical protein
MRCTSHAIVGDFVQIDNPCEFDTFLVPSKQDSVEEKKARGIEKYTFSSASH